MDDHLDFSAEEFHKMSYKERVQLCRRLAKRARKLAELSSPNQREPYHRIAGEWEKLADEMERLD